MVKEGWAVDLVDRRSGAAGFVAGRRVGVVEEKSERGR